MSSNYLSFYFQSAYHNIITPLKLLCYPYIITNAIYNGKLEHYYLLICLLPLTTLIILSSYTIFNTGLAYLSLHRTGSVHTRVPALSLHKRHCFVSIFKLWSASRLGSWTSLVCSIHNPSWSHNQIKSSYTPKSSKYTGTSYI